ncbi:MULTISPECIES: DUF669 domain-containing protein [unclassified Lactococcus]|uniref:DUF669 domain-containing protein n=1 Tax=unclassified Lactococcus TaxID=2643510 RepID=UPI0011CC48FC|nr:MULTISPECIES: DUF669 domain-containing protein [unclassified Lactococcus]MQW23910.1 DUF669 domain-containing protein [Lactococcus sp. dk101]TXK37138.1 DUF669 domain-containing protein [Lactococcus sp. dk310]TXK47992.1 DUF669 domain-containing protein [Lactococcus sp. dk322]
MSLLDIANEIKNSGFDARKDSANGAAQIPAGSYNVMLRSASFKIAPSGWEMLRYEFDIIDGDFAGRTEYTQFGTLEEWNGKNLKWAVERTTKFFQKAIALADDGLFESDFADGAALAQALQRKAVGSFYTLQIDDRQSKGKTFRQYDLEQANELSMQASQAPAFNEDDLPFN